MPELLKKVETYRALYTCDEKDCGGDVVFDGISYPTPIPQYPHTCNKCGKTYTFNHKYSFLKYEYKEVE